MSAQDQTSTDAAPGTAREADRLRQELATLRDELAHAQRLATLGVLAGSIAHEFNNILTPVMSYAQLALGEPENADLTRKALGKAIAGTERASTIASSILGFIRGEDGEMVHVAHAVRDALQCLVREPERDGVRLETDIHEGAWARIGPVALEQVLMNLLLNAREAILPRSGSITIRAERSTWNTPNGDDQDAVLITVSDTGKGMPPELAARAFEPFVRGDRGETTGRRRSTGLGLSISRRLIEEAGGSIEVASEVGRGTTFTIRLPAADPAAVGAGA